MARDCASDLDGSIPFHFEALSRRRWLLSAHSEQRKQLEYAAAALAGVWTQSLGSAGGTPVALTGLPAQTEGRIQRRAGGVQLGM